MGHIRRKEYYCVPHLVTIPLTLHTTHIRQSASQNITKNMEQVEIVAKQYYASEQIPPVK